MPMSGKSAAINDAHVAALRAFLTLEDDEAQPRTGQLVDDDVKGYGGLLYAAFITAAHRRFSPAWTAADVVRYVAAARAELLQDDITIDPRASEILLRRALGDTVTTDSDEEINARAQIFLLSEMIAAEDLDTAELDAFLAQARALADRLFA